MRFSILNIPPSHSESNGVTVVLGVRSCVSSNSRRFDPHLPSAGRGGSTASTGPFGPTVPSSSMPRVLTGIAEQLISLFRLDHRQGAREDDRGPWILGTKKKPCGIETPLSSGKGWLRTKRAKCLKSFNTAANESHFVGAVVLTRCRTTLPCRSVGCAPESRQVSREASEFRGYIQCGSRTRSHSPLCFGRRCP